ncbi:MAG: DUF4864 domain-containing protein [Proteobacteria bacterium]|nr:DUF4864 domain-containing protein [Pseudomonadota bacterium]MBI3498470.1 DUF4864 domain-containing protein [Pseudomonadota bacterium]
MAVAWLAGGGAEAASPSVGESDRQAIRSVIQNQIQAFQKDDGDLAFSFASPMIHGLFGTPENFMAMVRGGYRPVYRPRDVQFRDIVDYQGQLTQRVLVIGPDGKPVMALYMMEQQPDGSWRINGCVLTETDDTSA